jgi:hypothetical protein
VTVTLPPAKSSDDGDRPSERRKAPSLAGAASSGRDHREYATVLVKIGNVIADQASQVLFVQRNHVIEYLAERDRRHPVAVQRGRPGLSCDGNIKRESAIDRGPKSNTDRGTGDALLRSGD